MGIVKNWFGGKPPPPPKPGVVAAEASELSKGNQLWNAQQQWGQNQKTGPYGGVYTDPTTGAQTQQFASGIQPSVGNVQGALGAQTGLLPTGAFNPNTNADAYRSAFVNQGLTYAMPQWANEDDAWKTTREERGLPIASEIDAKRNQQVASNRNQYLGDLSSRAYQAGANEEQRQFGNQLTQYRLPGEMASGMFDLLGRANGLLPGYNPQYQFNSADPSQAFVNTTNANYKNAMDQYNANQAALGGLFGGIGKFALGPMTPGGFGATNLGGLFNGLFGNGGWKTVTKDTSGNVL